VLVAMIVAMVVVYQVLSNDASTLPSTPAQGHGLFSASPRAWL
jgi:hypothetical protein